MAIPSIYLNLEDDVAGIVARLRHQKNARQVVLVCPKRCSLFGNPENLMLLKQQADFLGKEISILTMDERGREFAQQAGFALKFLPKVSPSDGFSDVKMPEKIVAPAELPVSSPEALGFLAGAVKEIKRMAPKFITAKILDSSAKAEAPQEAPPPAAVMEPVVEEVEVTETFFPEEIVQNYLSKDKKSHWQTTLTGLVAISLILILLLAFVVLPKASVAVYPKTEPVTRDMEINVSANASSLDLAKLVLPGTPVNENVSINSQFQSQGKLQVGNKASGEVQIYNFTRQPINLKSSTTILSIAGKNYTLLNDIAALKPTLYKNAKTKEVDPGSLEAPVEIIAGQGGEDYDLPAGTRLEISNQVFGSRPLLLYAKTSSEISGGTTRYLSVITADDLDAAKTQAEAQGLDQIRKKLALSGLVLPDNAYTLSEPQFTSDNPVGTETPSFQTSLQAKISGLAFNADSLNTLIYERIEQTLDSDKVLQAATLDQITYKVKSFDANNNLVVLSLHFQGQTVFKVNLQNIAPELVGKSQSQVNEILRSQAEIDRVDITLAPVWQKNFPLFASQIKLTIASSSPEAQ